MKDGTVYYLDENGKKATGWQTIDDKRYYFQEDGTLARDMVREGKEVYYLNEEGYVYTGWRHVNGNSYYFDEYGMMYTDMTVEIDGEEYVFDSYGRATSKADIEKAEAEQEAQSSSSSSNSSSSNSSSSSSASSSASSGQSYNVNGNGIVQAALAQVGNIQDCTMLVTNALAANGIYYHGWPSGYLSLGTVTSNRAAGRSDLLCRRRHGHGAHRGLHRQRTGRTWRLQWQPDRGIYCQCRIRTGLHPSELIKKLKSHIKNDAVLQLFHIRPYFRQDDERSPCMTESASMMRSFDFSASNESSRRKFL